MMFAPCKSRVLVEKRTISSNLNVGQITRIRDRDVIEKNALMTDRASARQMYRRL